MLSDGLAKVKNMVTTVTRSIFIKERNKVSRWCDGGNVECELGQWNFISKRYGIYYEGYMFPLFVKEQLDQWPEKNVRRRVWMTVAQAREVCQHWWMKEALDILVQRLISSDQ
ncbi:Nudix hydrolase 17, mitochondrial, variant 2 [Trifolium repens]|nr:Nudix hydrolase 17, mitochondrial, variant 2 [Trifolium repens]